MAGALSPIFLNWTALTAPCCRGDMGATGGREAEVPGYRGGRELTAATDLILSPFVATFGADSVPQCAAMFRFPPLKGTLPLWLSPVSEAGDLGSAPKLPNSLLADGCYPILKDMVHPSP
jgi:hypothetical protein